MRLKLVGEEDTSEEFVAGTVAFGVSGTFSADFCR